jgi:putative hydrolase of the HAD superfamily
MIEVLEVSRPDAIVFDLDDTLYPQEDYKRSGFKVVAEWTVKHSDLGYEACFNELERILSEKGPSYHYMFDDMTARMGLDRELVPEMVRVFIQHKPQLTCYEGVFPMLSRLRRHFKLGILTDGPVDVQRKKVEALGLDSRIDKVLYSDSLGKEKPDTELFAWFEKAFALPGAGFVYVGDNPVKDFTGAKKRNWKTVRVLTGEHRDKQESSGLAVDATLPAVTDMENWIWSRKA